MNRFVSAQNNYSLLERRVEHEVLPACDHFGLGFLPFFPLASGLLTGKYRRGEAPPEGTRLAAWGARGASALSNDNFEKIEKLEGYAVERGHTLLELAFAWLLGHGARLLRHRRRHPHRASQRQRRRRRLETDGRGGRGSDGVGAVGG